MWFSRIPAQDRHTSATVSSLWLKSTLCKSQRNKYVLFKANEAILVHYGIVVSNLQVNTRPWQWPGTAGAEEAATPSILAKFNVSPLVLHGKKWAENCSCPSNFVDVPKPLGPGKLLFKFVVSSRHCEWSITILKQLPFDIWKKRLMWVGRPRSWNSSRSLVGVDFSKPESESESLKFGEPRITDLYYAAWFIHLLWKSYGLAWNNF